MKKSTTLIIASLLIAAGAKADGTDVTAIYITNPGFEDCESMPIVVRHDNQNDIDVNVIDLYSAWNEEKGEDYEATGWKLVAKQTNANGGVVTYGNNIQVGKYATIGEPGPTKGVTGEKGLCFCGAAGLVYQQTNEITLPAGTYRLTVNLYARNGQTSNPGPTQQVTNIKTGFMPTGGTEDNLIPAIRKSQQFTSNAWDQDVLEIELTQPTTGRFQICYGSSYFVVVDDVKLEYQGGVVTTALNAVIVKAKALNSQLDNSTLAAAIGAAEAFIANPTTQDDVTTQMETLYTAMATALAAVTEPVEITEAYLGNASFETGTIEPWSWGSTSGTIGEPVNGDSKPFIDGNNVVEFTQSASNSLYQNIAHLPAGYYLIDAKLNQKAYLKVGENRKQLQGGKDALYLRVHPTAYNLPAGEELTVSASATTAFRVDNFRLFYGKDEASLLARLLQDVKADAQAILAMTQFDVVTGSERTTLLTALEGTDADAINTAANAFVTAKDSYSELAKSKAAAAAYTLDDYPYASKAIYQQIQTLIATDATSADDAKTMKEQLDNLCMQLYVTNAYCEGVEGATDCTEKIVDANATESASAWAMQNMTIRTDKTGWNNPKTNQTDKVVYGVTSDYYRASKDQASILKQTLKGLAAGKYALSMTMMGSNNLEVNVFFNKELVGTMKAAGTSGGGKYGAGWNDYVMTFDKADDSDMPLQLQCKPTANYQEWYIDNFRLYLLPASSPGQEKCATPTIEFVDGKLTFSCETEGVEFVSEVSVSDAKKYEGNEVSLTGSYTVSVYAKKAGFENSDIASLTFTMGSNGEPCDTNKDGKVDVADIATVITRMAAE